MEATSRIKYRLFGGAFIVVVAIGAVLGWASLARVEGDTERADDSTNASIDQRIHLQYHTDDAGNVEGYTLSKDGRVLLILWDDDGDGILNTWDYYVDGTSHVRIKDRNGDRKPDWWQVRTGLDEGILAEDNDYDGVVDEESAVRFVSKY